MICCSRRANPGDSGDSTTTPPFKTYRSKCGNLLPRGNYLPHRGMCQDQLPTSNVLPTFSRFGMEGSGYENDYRHRVPKGQTQQNNSAGYRRSVASERKREKATSVSDNKSLQGQNERATSTATHPGSQWDKIAVTFKRATESLLSQATTSLNTQSSLANLVPTRAGQKPDRERADHEVTRLNWRRVRRATILLCETLLATKVY